VDPLLECGSAVDDLLELPGVPGFRGVADMVKGPKSGAGELYKKSKMYINPRIILQWGEEKRRFQGCKCN
jgi:hypothetical protein